MPSDSHRVAVVARRISGLSGVTILIQEHASRAAAAGWTIDAIGERIDERSLREAGATPRRVRGRWYQRTTPAWFAGAAAAATSTGYALVHGHGDILEQDVLSLHNCIHAAYEAQFGTPLTTDAPAAEPARLHERQLTERRFRALLVNSNLMRDDVMRRFGVPDAMIRVVYPGFDPAQYRPRPRTQASLLLRRQLGVGDEAVLAGLVTSGDWSKRGVSDFIEALGVLSRSGMRVHGLVTGKERLKSRYRALANRYGVADRVHFLAPRELLADLYGALDVFVYPAQFEEFGMCVQEAMACGLPLVAGRRIGATELLDPVAAKLLLDTVNAASVADRLASFVGDAELRRRTGALNAASVAKNTWDTSAAGVIATYNHLVTA